MVKGFGIRRFEAHATGRMLSLEGTPLASFRRRAAAFLLDMAVVLIVVVLLGLPGALREVREGRSQVVAVPFDPFHSAVGLAVTVSYFGLATWSWRGRTLGKRLLRIRVVSLSHERVTLWQSFERALGYGASALEAGFGFLQVLFHPNRQAVHDRIAETVVVWEGAPAALEKAREGGAPSEETPPQGEGAAEA